MRTYILQCLYIYIPIPLYAHTMPSIQIYLDQELFEFVAGNRRVTRIVIVEKAVNLVYVFLPRLNIRPPSFQPWGHILPLVIFEVILPMPADPANIDKIRGHIDPLG